MTNDLISELSRLHRRATDLRAREIQLADAGENDPASDTWKTAAIVAASAECEFHAALVTAWPTISRVLREAAEGPAKITPEQLSRAMRPDIWEDDCRNKVVPRDGQDEDEVVAIVRETHLRWAEDAISRLYAPPPATETTKTEEPRHD